MNSKVGTIGIESVEEHEDGSATYQLHMDDKAQAMVIEEGMKFILHCATAKMDIGEVYDWILSHVPQDEDIRPMTDEERQRAKEREEANSVHSRV